MELPLDTLMLTLAMAGTAAYTGYLIEKKREDIRKTIQIVEMKDAEFWQGLTELRDLVPARV